MTNYKTIQALSKDAHRAAEGTLAFVAEKGGELYVRARNGWRKVQVRQLFLPLSGGPGGRPALRQTLCSSSLES